MAGTSTFVLLLAGVLLLGAGFAAGYLVHPDAPPAVEEPPAIERGLERQGSEGAPSLREEEGALAARLESPRAAQLEPLRRAIESLPPPTIPTGTGVITGTVLTEAGEPLAGVEVRASPSEVPVSVRGPKRKPDELDLPTRLQRFVATHRWHEGTRTSAVTGADGTYRLEGLIAGKHSLHAQKTGWSLRAEGTSHGLDVGSTLDYVAKRRTKIRVDVYLPDGSQPDRAQIRFEGAQGSRQTSWTPEQPNVVLPPGSYRAVASAGDDQEYASDPIAVTVVADEAPPSIRADLKERPVLQGTLVFEDDHGGERAMVRIVRLPKGRDPDPALLGPESQSAHARALRGGPMTFRFVDLAPGRYLVGAARAWQGPVVATEVVEFGGGLVKIELDVPLPKREQYVILRVFGPDGTLEKGKLQISTGYRGKTGSSSGGSTMIERKNGERWVFHHASGVGTAEDGVYTITARHPVYGTQEATYAQGTAPTIDIRFDEPATLEVEITGLIGTVYEGRIRAQVRTEENQSVQMRQDQGAPDGEGRVHIEGLQPGTYELQLHMDRGRWGGSALATQSVTVKRGTNRARISMPPLYSVTIEGVTGRGFLQRQGEHRFHRMITGASDGRAVVDGLPAGDYSAHVGQKKAVFSLPGPTTVRLE